MTTLLELLLLAALVQGSTVATPDPRTTTELKVLSFNILQGGGNASNVGFPDSDFGGSRRDDVARVIEASGADLIGLQELYSGGEALLAELGDGWNLAGTVLSRYPLHSIESETFFSICRVVLPGGRSVVLVNTHWWPAPYGPTWLQEQLRGEGLPTDPAELERVVLEAVSGAGGPRGYDRTVKAVRSLLEAGETVIVTGDFNEPSHLDWTEAAAERGEDRWVKNPTERPLRFAIRWRGSSLMIGAGLRDAYRTVFPDEVANPGYSWTPAYPNGTPGRRLWDDQVHERIDRVYFGGEGIEATDAAVIGESAKKADIAHDGPWPSDHRAVFATFRLAEPPNPARVPRSAIARRLVLLGPVVAEPDYTIWGASPVQHEGETHLFVARWPEANVDPAWRKSSEIAHYVGPGPEGPFRFSDVAVTGTGEGTWDRWSAHNPEVRRYEGKFALVYVSNSDYRQPPHPLNQRIGMVIAESPYGPWKRVGDDGLILEPSPDPKHWSHGSQVVNPALFKVGERYHLYFKSHCQGQRGLVYGLAVSDSLEGPYRIEGGPLTSRGVTIEDGSVFEWQEKVCLLTTDNHGQVTGVRGGGVLWVSEDGVNFDPEWTQLGYGRIPRYHPAYDEAKVTRVYGGDPKLERPKVLSIDGAPRYLYAPSGWNVYGGKRTVLHLLRIDLDETDGPLPIPTGARGEEADR